MKSASQIDSVTILKEPTLQFAGGHNTIDPHDGLTLFGPYGLDGPTHPRSPTYILLGTTEGIYLFQKWARMMNKASYMPENEKHRLWPPFPGFELAFGSKWNEKPAWTGKIDREDLIIASRKGDQHERTFAVVEMFMKHFEKLKKLDYNVNSAICIIPEEVWKNCRPKSIIVKPSDDKLTAKQKKSRKAGQMEFWDKFDFDQYHYAPDFRRQLKARTMQYEIPLQIIRESTLVETDEDPLTERRLTTLSDRMWNLSTALYYKAGGKPWRLNSAREGVCYIGISYKLGEKKTDSACCAAQMFLDTGDGIVFLGDDKPIYSPKKKTVDTYKRCFRKAVKRGIGNI